MGQVGLAESVRAHVRLGVRGGEGVRGGGCS